MAGDVVDIKVCIPFKLPIGLTGKYSDVRHYSYTQPLRL